MKTWIDWFSRSAGEMLFNGGYVATPRGLATLRDVHDDKGDASLCAQRAAQPALAPSSLAAEPG